MRNSTSTDYTESYNVYVKDENIKVPVEKFRTYNSSENFNEYEEWLKKYGESEDFKEYGELFEKLEFLDEYNSWKSISKPCRYCKNHPFNGGSGICNCILGGYDTFTC